MKPSVSMCLQKYGVYVLFGVAVLLCLVWISNGIVKKAPSEETMDRMDHQMFTPSVSESQGQTQSRDIANNDAAVRGYLTAAQTLAEVYKFQNGGSYGGLCEGSDRLYTLEGESGGILKYIKSVGATEVFCSTSDAAYLVEAKMPINGHFYCIDNLNNPVEQASTREGFSSCR